ncbi:MAG: oxidoreductase, short chain dehydrogenase [Sphingomonadales bacterium]|nr:oxidoreductase, short chain dehydrogenase [Sphingomonadales bacterium]
MRINGKVALVTGGSSGIGEGIVRRFILEGAIVYLGDIDIERGNEIAAETGAIFVPLDVSKKDNWLSIATKITAAHGQLDILVNNAGVISGQPIDAIDEAAWDRVMTINVTGPMLGCQIAIQMVQAAPAPRSLSIINVASTTSFLGLANDVAYTASKHAVLGLTRSAAAHCAREKLPVRINTLHPGTTLTAILQGHIDGNPAMRAVFDAMSPMGRMAAPSEEAAVALFLASDESSYCTGAAFVADGGLTAMHPAM